ncbi:hypothetical protein, partial [Streptomyces palmae]|uniref:hypothetical protein n=1 Tax=Streptomyces palmae TaxID=1701085 RepID=UPI001AE0DFFB
MCRPLAASSPLSGTSGSVFGCLLVICSRVSVPHRAVRGKRQYAGRGALAAGALAAGALAAGALAADGAGGCG